MNKLSKTIAIIPSRLESTRLPNKAITDICGLPMIIHVYKRCLLSKTLDEVYVATDSLTISKIVKLYGGNVIMTSSSHQTGTDRIAEASINLDCEFVVNVQGDEALLDPNHIDKIICELKQNSNIDVALLVSPYSNNNIPSDIKVVLNNNNDVMYLSRSDIPSDTRTIGPPKLKAYHVVNFRKDFLLKYSKWKKTALEEIESNEYIRILEHGYNIRAVHVESDAISVDTEDDLEYVRNKMKTDFWFSKYK